MQTTTHTARTVGGEFIEASILFLRDDFMHRLLHVVNRLEDEDIWWRPNDASNSVGNLILHLSGNVRQWIGHSIGGIPFERNRDREFSEQGPTSKDELISRIQDAVAEAESVIRSLPQEGLLGIHRIQKYDVTALQAIYHVVEHFSHHLGQILYIYKLRTGVDPKFYEGI
jgi:uncharacterized damage-inducible protein DinB